jgi:hypothetical protein
LRSEGETLQTFRILDFFQSLPQYRTILQLQTSLIRSDRLVIPARTVERSTFARIPFRPRRVEFHALVTQSGTGSRCMRKGNEFDGPARHPPVRRSTISCRRLRRCDSSTAHGSWGRWRWLVRRIEWLNRSLWLQKPCFPGPLVHLPVFESRRSKVS